MGSLLISIVFKKKIIYILLWTNLRWGLNYGSRLPQSMIFLDGIDGTFCLLELRDRHGFWLSHEAKEGLDQVGVPSSPVFSKPLPGISRAM